MNCEHTDEEKAPLHSKRFGRELAMEFLYSCELRGETPGAAAFEVFLETAQEEFQVKDNHLLHRAANYAKRLYEEYALDREMIDKLLADHCRSWSWERISAVDRNILRVAMSEMLHFDDVPLVVSIDEAVEISGDFSGVQAGNYVNGILNGIKNEMNAAKREE